MTQQNATTEHWAAWQQRRLDNPHRWTEWSEHPYLRALLQQRLFGGRAISPFDHIHTHFPAFAHAHAISLCCGDGSTERALVEQGAFRSMLGIDMTAERVNAARAARGALAERLDYRVGNVNQGDYGTACCDVVFAKAALHHVEQLETMVAGIFRCLRPDGYLVTLDFFGPTRFQWTDAQLAYANDFLTREVPEPLRQRADSGRLYEVTRPAVADMIAMDPSEAVRSGELHAFLQEHFNLVMDVPIGGTLLHLIFDPSIINNFNPDDTSHQTIIERAVALDQRLVATGVLNSDFRLIVARPRTTA